MDLAYESIVLTTLSVDVCEDLERSQGVVHTRRAADVFEYSLIDMLADC